MATRDREDITYTNKHQQANLGSMELFNELLHTYKNHQYSGTTITHNYEDSSSFNHQRHVSCSSGEGIVKQAPQTFGQQEHHVSRKILRQKGVLGHIDPSSGKFIAKNNKIANKYITKEATKDKQVKKKFE